MDGLDLLAVQGARKSQRYCLGLGFRRVEEHTVFQMGIFALRNKMIVDALLGDFSIK